MNLLQFMEWTCFVVTVLLFATGISPCFSMYKTGDTKNVPYTIFLLSAIGCIGMTHYGILLDNTMLVLLNLIGSSLNVIYSVLYLYLVKDKPKPLFYMSLFILYFVVLYGYVLGDVVDDNTRAETIGKWSSTVTMVTVSLPAVEIIDNLKNKNADGMPTIMLLGGLLCGSSWLIYGFMLQDPNIYAPNFPGIAINLAKLYIVSLYGSSDHKKVE